MITLTGFMFNKVLIGILVHQAVEKIQWDSVYTLLYMEQMFSYSYIQQIFIGLLCARNYSGYWGYKEK